MTTTPTPSPQLFTAEDYAALHALVFRPDYPGYKPNIIEAPNGDATARDVGKRYAHVAPKYLDKLEDKQLRETLYGFYYRAWERAFDLAWILRIPRAFWPSIDHGALRVLEYPAGTGSAIHTDPDLFTVMCYRDQPDKFVRCSGHDGLSWGAASGAWESDVDPMLHVGELGQMVGLGPAQQHFISRSDTPQHSLVYFSIPSHEAVLPSGVTVGEWIAERIARSRYDK